MLQILEIVVQMNTMLLQEGMDLHSCVIAEELLQLSGGDLTFPVSFKGNRFQGCAGEIVAGGVAQKINLRAN